MVNVLPALDLGFQATNLNGAAFSDAAGTDLPRTFAGKLELRTSNGALRIASGLGAVNKTGKRSATVHLSDAESPDAPTSTIRTSNGSITVNSAEGQG